MKDRDITGDETVKELAERSPALHAILHEAGLDLCCGGAHPLKMAAKAHGVDLPELLARLNAARRGGR